MVKMNVSFLALVGVLLSLSQPTWSMEDPKGDSVSTKQKKRKRVSRRLAKEVSQVEEGPVKKVKEESPQGHLMKIFERG